MSDASKLKKADIETPALLVDLDVMEQNLDTMTRFFHSRPARLRPHFKNHRVLELAARQMERGAIGITCARLWQAERLAGFGIRDILIANEIAGESPIDRFVELSREVPVLVAVDHPKVVADMARLARDRKTEVNVLVDVDLGLKRCGMPPGEPAAALAKMVVGSGLKFRGLMGYEGQLHPLLPGPDKERAVTEAMQALARTKTLIESGGIPAGIFSCGGTGDYSIAGAYAGVTENQAGVVGLTRAMAADYAPDHIRVNAIVPGTIDTPMNAIALADPKNRARYAEMAPACRLGTPEDLSGIAVYLASEDSSYCVGGIFTVDGGLTAV